MKTTKTSKCARLLVIALFLFITHAGMSQDVIKYKNGKESRGRITEISKTEIKFKKEDNPNGPDYTILKSDVFEVQYSNGSKDVFGDQHLYNKNPPEPIEEIQDDFEQLVYNEPLKFSGPRIGFTIIAEGSTAEELRDRGKNPHFITQFGWQFEVRTFTLEDGTSGLLELVPLVGGIEQGMFLPSLSVLFGIRGSNGFEFAFGPNVSVSGAAIAIAAGTSFSTENVYFPINLALTTSSRKNRYDYSTNTSTMQKTGVRVSLLIGILTRKNDYRRR